MPTRRTFLQATAATTLGLSAVHAGGSDTIKVGLIGCGGRGRGAAANAVDAEPNVKITAVCDIFPEIAQNTAEGFSKKWGERAPIGERVYSGFDGYKQLIDSAGVDMVILATPPGFRPLQLEHAVKAGKHVFAEKPLAVDAPGVRSVLASAKLAKEKNLLCASGFCYRHHTPKIEILKRLHDGVVGDILTMQVSYNTGYLWDRGDKPEWSAMEKQIRNWLYYTWLSGDHLVEQAVHNIDKACWVMGKYPIAATALGGRQVRTRPLFGNIYDHFSVVYEYEGGQRVFAQCRQIGGCHGDVSDHIWGTKGYAELQKAVITGANPWQFGESGNDMYIGEHKNFFASIKAGKPINDMDSAANSTLMAILGRQAAYTGKKITWKQMLESKEELAPKTWAFGELPIAPVAMPGVTKFA